MSNDILSLEPTSNTNVQIDLEQNHSVTHENSRYSEIPTLQVSTPISCRYDQDLGTHKAILTGKSHSTSNLASQLEQISNLSTEEDGHFNDSFMDLDPLVSSDLSLNVSNSLSPSKSPSKSFHMSHSELLLSDDAPIIAEVSTPNLSSVENSLNQPDEVSPSLSYIRNRPRTQVFRHGKVFTYNELRTPEVSTRKSKPTTKSDTIERTPPDDIQREASVVPHLSYFNIDIDPFIPVSDSNGTNMLKSIRTKHLKNVIIGQLNINSLRNKFLSLTHLIKGNLDILILTETKLDNTFPEKQFIIPGYKKPYRRDRNRNGGGVMIYVREDIPSDILIKHRSIENVEAIFVEINLRKNRLLLVGTYHSTHKKYGTTDQTFFSEIGLALDVYTNRFDKFLLAGDFNIDADDDTLEEFMGDYLAKNLVKDPTCFKSSENPSCIDLFITNSYRSFQSTTTVSTGLSDFHKMTVTVLKTTYPKAKPRHLTYRTPYETADLEEALTRNIEAMPEKTYENFENAFTLSRDSVSTTKQRMLRDNEKPYITKEMRKAIMRRTQLQNRVFRYGNQTDIIAFNKHKNYCNRLAKRERKKYYNNINEKDVTDNKKFWNTMKPFFSDKGGTRDQIMLLENDDIISDPASVAEIFNNYFQKSGSMSSLGITENKLLINSALDSETSLDVEKCIKKFENHPSIISINKHVVITEKFNFSPITAEDIDKQIRNLDPKKNGGCIPTKILKEMRHIVSKPLAEIWNTELIKNKNFSQKLKVGDITPIFKALQNSNVKNYRPITILVIVSKIFEKIMDKQSNSFIERVLSKYLCGYRTNYNPQTALVPMIENWKLARDKNGYSGGVLMDLSKAFDTINHDLLIAKMHAYGFSIDALKIIRSYLSDRWIRTKIDKSFSTWKEIFSGMPQGSVNGPKWFNLYLNDLFFLFTTTEVCNIADDSTPYACDMNLKILLQNVESDVASAIMWFDVNYMMLNQPKCHFLTSSNSPEHLWIQVGEQIIWESLKEKLLGVTIDKGLLFNHHVQLLCNKASAKLTALGRLIKIVSVKKKKILMNAFIESQFSYCPLVWMFCHSRKLNNRINHIQERGLRIVYEDNTSTFEELLKKDNSVSIHHRNIQLVAVEMFKVKYRLSPAIMCDIFKLNNYGGKTFDIPQVNTEYMGKLSLRYFGPVVWETLLPDSYKLITDLGKFKIAIKSWIPNCKCRLCKHYEPGVGYL